MIRYLSAFVVLLGWLCVVSFGQVPELLESGNPQEAVRQLEAQVKGSRAIEDKALLLSEIAKIQFDYLHDYSAAVRTCQNILDLQRKGLTRDEQLLAQFQMAKAYARLGQHPKAMTIYQSILDDNPPNDLSHQMAQRYIRAAACLK